MTPPIFTEGQKVPSLILAATVLTLAAAFLAALVAVLVAGGRG